MANIWTQNDDESWRHRAIDGARLGLRASEDAAHAVHVCDAQGDAALVTLVRSDSDERQEWALVCADPKRVRVNGAPVFGLRMLEHRDELRLDAGRALFSTETLPVITPFAGPKGAKCPRCMLEIEHETDSVRCPTCHVAHHQTAKRPCWTYSDLCAACVDHPTALDGGYRWTPEDL
ncbi:MAG: hypothetical protein CMJ18_11740 [Phycisphaeraceae bacterium]|nr:hypothetical protein [Phycisphaeraceae bacterium]